MSEPTKQIDCVVKLVRRIYPRFANSGDWQVCDVELVRINEGKPIGNRFSVTGNMVLMVNDDYVGEYRIVGNLVFNEKYQRYQYEVVYSQEIYELNTLRKQKLFLQQIMTEKQLDNLLKRYPDNPLQPIKDHNISLLVEVSGMGDKTAYRLIERYESCKDYGKAYIELAEYGLTKRMIEKLVDSYGSPDVAVSKVKANPYTLIEEIDGIGFLKADSIALNAGFDEYGWERCKAFILDFFREKAEEGNSFITYDDLLDALDTELGTDFPDESLKQAMRHLEDTKTIWVREQGDEVLLALKKYYDLELSVARHLKRLMEAPSNLQIDKETAMTKIKEQEARQGWEFTEQQLEGVFTAMSNNVTIIRGYGGCVDCDTEYFNGTEWKRIADYQEGEQVLQYNEDGSATLVNPKKFVKFEEDTMYHFKTKYGVDQCLSWEHRVVYKENKELQVKPFHEVLKIHSSSKQGFTGKFLTTFTYNEQGIDKTDKEIQSQVPNILKGDFEPYWYNCNKHQFELVCCQLLLQNPSLANGEFFYTPYKRTADFIQFAFATICKRCEIKVKHDGYYLALSNLTQLSIGGEVKIPIVPVPTKDGYKYCFEVDSSMLVLRRNGKIFITGNTGKSSCVTGLLACAPDDYTFKQTALSGKASVNLTDITGEEGYTIHRLLGVDPESGKFVHNQNCPLEGDLFILDEGSMVDIPLVESLLQAIPTGAKLIILGDTNQLESIGVGNFMLDMIDSEYIPVITFDKVHRQGAKSAIIGESIKVAKGLYPVKYGWEGEEILGELKDLKYIGFNVEKGTPKPTIDLIIKEYKKFYQECKDISQIAVILPTKERGSSCYKVNIQVQDYVLPSIEKRGTGMKMGENGDYPYTIYKGDKVINLRNAKPKKGGSGDVDKPIFNGNTGEVLEVGFDYLLIDFYGIGEVTVRGSQLQQIGLGYAITTHKCLHGNTSILTNKGVLQLKDLDCETQEGDYIELDGDVKVFNGYEFETPSHFYNAGVNKTVKIKTSLGYEIESTLDHKFEVINSKGQKMVKQAQDIDSTDLMIMKKGANVFGEQMELPKEWFDIPKQDVRAIIYDLPKEMSKPLARFLGFMVADGVITGSGFSLGKQWKEVVEQFCEDVEYLFGYECKSKMYHIPSMVDGGLGMWKVECASKFLRDFLRNIEGLNSNNKRVPTIIKQTKREYVVEFLRAVFEDGTVRLKKGAVDSVNLQLKDENIIVDIQQMLLNLGIVASKKQRINSKAPNTHHILYIYGENIDLYYKEIGFFTKFKQDRLVANEGRKRLGDQNIIGGASVVLKGVNKTFNDMPKSLRNRINQAHTKDRATIQLVVDTIEWLDSTNKSYVPIEEYRFLLEGFFVQPILELQEGESQCYCITMPITHHFIQNGFYGLNCQGSTIPYTIFGLDYTHFSMLTRQLVYTGETRAKKKSTVIFETSALIKAIKTNNIVHKDTFLYYFLKGSLPM